MMNPIAVATMTRDALLTPARVTQLFDDGRVRVDVAGGRTCLVLCASGVPYLLAPDDDVFVWLPNDPASHGVVLGRIGASRAAEGPEEPPAELVLEARSALSLRVGDGSIEIRADGKILIKGSDLVSHATRTNRIKGGAVAIN